MSRIVINPDGTKKRVRTEADARASRKWDSAHVIPLAYKARKEYADRVKAVAAANGTTVSAIIHSALDAYLVEHETPDVAK